MFRDKISKFFKKQGDTEEKEGNDKKKIENLVFFVIISIITIIVINFIWNGNETKNENTNENVSDKKLASSTNNGANNNESNISTNDDTSQLEQKLEQILSNIQGVGEVKVCINYSESSQIVAMYDENSSTSTTEETDTEGGTRKIEQTDTEKSVIYEENDGKKTPITTKIIKPKIEGAIITAKGAGDASVKTNIIQAVEALTGLATHKIQVFEMNRD